MENCRPIVMVSSSVYGQEELLERIYSLLTSFGYEVWMSHKGPIPTTSDESSLESCLNAVKNCDIFLWLITQNYGTIKDGVISATHSEFKMAIKLNDVMKVLIMNNMSSSEIAIALELKSVSGALKRAIDILENKFHFIEKIVPQKARSKMQKYHITSLGTNFWTQYNQYR